jgi:hypothetical protein
MLKKKQLRSYFRLSKIPNEYQAAYDFVLKEQKNRFKFFIVFYLDVLLLINFTKNNSYGTY